MYWDICQNIRIREARRNAAHAAERTADVAADVQQLRASLDRALLINRAMWELLSQHHGLTEQDLDAKVQEIDLRDGSLDGKMTAPVTECPSCHRTMSRRHGRCLYCGHEGERDPFDSGG